MEFSNTVPVEGEDLWGKPPATFLNSFIHARHKKTHTWQLSWLGNRWLRQTGRCIRALQPALKLNLDWVWVDRDTANCIDYSNNVPKLFVYSMYVYVEETNDLGSEPPKVLLEFNYKLDTMTGHTSRSKDRTWVNQMHYSAKTYSYEHIDTPKQRGSNSVFLAFRRALADYFAFSCSLDVSR